MCFEWMCRGAPHIVHQVHKRKSVGCSTSGGAQRIKERLLEILTKKLDDTKVRTTSVGHCPMDK